MGLALLAINLAILNREIFSNAGVAVETKLFQPPPQPAVTTCDEECQRIIDQRIAEIAATLSAQKTTMVKETSRPTTSYIPIGAAASTKKTDWIDVKVGEVYIDPADYGGSPTVSWEASLKVAHGNGKTFARLFDATNGIAVAGSEISVENSADYKQVSSGNLAFWRGRNLYRVQIKSLNTFEVFIDSARIKIVTE